MTKEELKQYRSLKREIGLLEENIKTLRTSLFSAPKLDGMPKSNYSADRTSEIIAKIVDLENLLQDKIDKYIETRTEIEVCINSLPADERLLMRYRYIEGMSWEETAVAMHYSWQHIHRIHGRILQKMRVNESA